jgi:signal transduction histidine kinase/CheY-like chemotaxis protein
VLILEDQPTDAELMVRELRRAMFDPTWQRVEAESDYVAHLDPALDVILADYKLPQFDAVCALQRLQERGLDIPFIVVSGAISEEVAVECMKQGAADYLLKDRLARLGQAVAQALEQRRLRRERRRAEEARQALYKASLEVQELLGLQERLDRLFQTAQTVLELDRVAVLLADPEGRWLQVLASRGVEEPLEAIRFPIGPEGGGLAQAYLTQQRVVWDGEAPLPERLLLQPPYDRIVPFRSQAFAIVPLVVQGRAIGVLLGADWKHSRQPLEPAMLELLQLFASQAALSIEHARLYEMQRRAAIRLEATVEARTRELQTANVQLQETMRLVEEASRHKSEFLANMSHELRTPLNSVIGFSDLLLEQTMGPLNENQARFLTNIRNSGQHLLQLIRDILDLSKVEAGKVVLQPQPLPVATTLEDILVLARGLAHKKAQTVEAQIDPELPPLRADPVRFKQILFNLLSNAVKFTPDGGRVTVTARRVPSSEFHVPSSEPGTWDLEPGTAGVTEFVEIAVRDSGIGIKAEDLPRLFQEFVQLEATATQHAEGTGLGLALTRRLVELHGGRIWAESAGEGRGSVFTVRLPLSPAG